MKFEEKLSTAIRTQQTVLCVGLDPDWAKIPLSVKNQYDDPADAMIHFCKTVIERTLDYCCAYKPNMAFFEALGPRSFDALHEVMDSIPSTHIKVADAKRGDIGNTAGKYKEAFFDQLGADALTVNPLMGMDSISPYLDDESKAIYGLTYTSNPGAADILAQTLNNGQLLAQHIAGLLNKADHDYNGHAGMVVGATQASKLTKVLVKHPKASLLIPGIGAQGGSVEDLAEALVTHEGLPLVNSSRAIIFAGGDDENWADIIQAAALKTKQSLAPISQKYLVNTTV